MSAPAARARLSWMPAALALAGRAAFAQPDASPAIPAATVPVTDAATALVEQLLTLVPVRGAITGQRPYAVREVARLAAAVEAELARRDRGRAAAGGEPGRAAGRPAYEARAAAIAAALRATYGVAPTPATTVRLRALDFVWAHGVGSGEAPRAVPTTNGVNIGLIDARTLPPLDLRHGRPAVQGAVGSVETAHALGVGGWLALVAQPRVSAVAERAPDGAGGAAVRTGLRIAPQRLFARAVVRNVAVQAGLDEWRWGQGGAGGTFVSASAPPLRTVSVGSDTAFALPGVLRGAGRWRAALAVADLGRSQNFPHARLAFYKVSLAPSPRVELGGGVMSQFNGRGAPQMSPYQVAIDLAPYIGWLDKGSDLGRSNKIAAFDARVRAPGWAGFTAAWEANLDDMDFRRFWGILRDDATHTLDLRWARLRADGSLALALTGQRTGIRMYQHTPFVSGVTYQRRIIGTPLGPHATGLGAELTWRPRPFDALTLEVAAEGRDASLYRTLVDGADAQNFRFDLVESRPVERRLRLAVSAARATVGPGIALDARLGIERAGNYAFQQGLTITRPFGEAGARIRF